ncbi:SRPBCC family protein [Spirosoma foliorum]|uniref:SRPBCC domain-containing protein n=1 Tax=Spirosoma foliorum TaxID=2710596 RepID=A0A7G5GZG5_9BACT|nr:SRPBCC domain-containing protein [Spirosoma foliorum]QMW04257.1 SRPBCC domain-containing protein [Spirosoma foliorum]
MNSNLAFDFSVDKANNTITVKREFAAELPLVWDAYTKSEILDQWWAPKPWKARTKTMDFREGGHWHYAMVGPEGEEHWSWIDYQHIQPQQNFKGLDAFVEPDGTLKTDWPRSAWDVTFADKGEVTLVEINISYDDLAQLEATLQMGFKEGLSMAMEGLDELLPSLKK